MTTEGVKPKKRHHEQSRFCYSRPSYREARWERAVKVYTINQESKYLLVQGIPSVGVCKELIELFAIYGAVEEYRYLDEYPAEEFTDVYWIKFKKIQSARFAKKKLDMRSFYGGVLHVCYAPEYETVEDTREKLRERRQQVARKCREYFPAQGMASTTTSTKETKKETPDITKTLNSQQILGHDSLKKQYEVTSQNMLSAPSGSVQQTTTALQPMFPDLPFPPVNLPFHLYPPPPPPPDSNYPRIRTKHATLPLELQNATSIDIKETPHRKEAQLVHETQMRLKNPKSDKAPVMEKSFSSATQSLPIARDDTSRYEIDRDCSSRQDTTNTSHLQQRKPSEKRIVWNKQPNVSRPPSNASIDLRSEPGAW
eukprot:Seg5218.1 transcript_id=Seg5218.1/GoldUCD/mRNA.D3Y31 product="RNA-binding protein 48" protein_id=Seg5218.1/GoldUCD/D3Y31